MTKREIYSTGRYRGRDIASCQAVPEIGEEGGWVDGFEYRSIISTTEEQKEVFLQKCSIAEELNRQFFPFKLTVMDLDDMAGKKPYNVWKVFEDGITQGFLDVWQAHAGGFYKRLAHTEEGRED
jgi:hypothetical protein